MDSHWASLDVISIGPGCMACQADQPKELLTVRGRLRHEHHLVATYSMAGVHGGGQHGPRPTGVNWRAEKY